MADKEQKCWVCNGKDFTLRKQSDIKENLNSTNFAITNFEYGKTGELQQCVSCGFIQCADLDEVVKYYVDLEDTEYENTRRERKLQEERLVRYFKRYKDTGTLLDIGAGNGIMVEIATESGYHAEGIEPSKWLQKKAQNLGLLVHQGIFPHPKTPGPYDVITLVDVIEHVTEPGSLLCDIKNALAHNGIFVLVTPDVNSYVAKILGFKWWHYRIAHIGYFNKKNLTQLLVASGFEITNITRPSWYFTLKYLGVRFLSFFPKFLRFPMPDFLERITIPVNLRDSLLVVCKKDNKNA